MGHNQPGKTPFKVNQTAKVKHLNADLLDGKNASALSPKLLEFRAPVGPVEPGNLYVLRLPDVDPGVYLASYSIWMNVPQPAPTADSPHIVQCYLATLKGDAYVSTIGTTQMTTVGTGSPGLSGSGALTVNAGERVTLECWRTVYSSFTIIPDAPFQVTLVKMKTHELTTAQGINAKGRAGRSR